MRNRNYLWASIIPLGFALLQPVVKAEPEEATRGRRRWASPGRTRHGPADGSTRGWLKPRPKSTARAQLRYYRALSDLAQGLARAVGREITPATMTAVNTTEVK